MTVTKVPSPGVSRRFNVHIKISRAKRILLNAARFATRDAAVLLRRLSAEVG
jgi:hypothetical protein